MKITYKDLECEWCHGAGEISRDNSDGVAVEYSCTECNGTGIDQKQLDKLRDTDFHVKRLVEKIFKLEDKIETLEQDLVDIHKIKSEMADQYLILEKKYLELSSKGK